jgi:diacylglycerol kinase family enzyme
VAEGPRAAIAVFVNPRSRANRRNPRLAAEFQAIIGETGRVLAPKSLEELEAMAAALRASPPGVVAVHGGDGTLHRTLTALSHAWGDEPLPPVALLCGGTMNVVAASLGIAEQPATVLRILAESVRAGQPVPTIRHRCLRVGDRLGFVFGNGFMSNFLAEYYGGVTGYGPLRAVWLLARTFLSALVRGSFARRIFRRFEGEVRIDGQTLPRTRFLGLGAATVREVGLGFKLNHRADDDPERFGVLAIHAAPLMLAVDIPAVRSGRGIAPSRAFSGVASTMEVEPKQSNGSTSADMSYTIDGDLYTAPGTLRITVGPPISFVRVHATKKVTVSRRKLGAGAVDAQGEQGTTTGVAASGQLIASTGGDTMSGGQ